MADWQMAWNEIWALINIKSGDKVLDIGVGEEARSTKKLVELGAVVTAVDKDESRIALHKSLSATLIQCDASSLPFSDGYFDLAMAFATLHEIDPRSHRRVTREMVRVAKRLAIVESAPWGNPEAKAVGDIARRAYESMGSFEQRRPLGYWMGLLPPGVKVRSHAFTVKQHLDKKDVLKAAQKEGWPRECISQIKALVFGGDYDNKVFLILGSG